MFLEKDSHISVPLLMFFTYYMTKEIIYDATFSREEKLFQNIPEPMPLEI